MHFSSPSGQRLSWWWPWNRGAVGRLSSGYITVSTFLNISVKVTPNPLTGLKKSLMGLGTGDLLSGGGASGREGARRSRGGVQVKSVVVRPVHRRHREAADYGEPVLAFRRRRLRLERLGAAYRGVVPERDHADEQEDHEDPDAHHGGGEAVDLPEPDGGGEQEPDDGQRDEDLPAERHELVVAGAGQRAAQPDVAEEQEEDLDQEP